MENNAESLLYLQRKHCEVSYIASRDVTWVATMVGPRVRSRIQPIYRQCIFSPHPPSHPNMAASGSENLDGVGRNAKLKASEKQSTNQ